MTRGLIAGQGRLPVLVLKAMERDGSPVYLAEVEGFPSETGREARQFRIETLGTLVADLARAGVTELCLAGAIRRPALDPSLIDAATAPLVPRLSDALALGDDGALRAVIGIFEEAGIAVMGADRFCPDLMPPPGVLCGALEEGAAQDARRAEAVMQAMAAADLGQGCVVSGGQVLAVEALPGTDWMLRSLAAGHDGPAGGLLYKAPKPDQDRRVDLPTIGPQTIRAAAAAGLAGITIEAGGVLVLDRSEVISEAQRLGLWLWVRDGSA
ncbi:hypothetical protein LCGC14_2046640 [marine sediment metagenome]|uniref:LpxI C-terminal domain-containing protein n=1 Tax=marine sediment metagenome TaxID=412755 RepID=A0A0F9EQG7_9ZZZZ